jgi:integrase
MVFSVVSQRTQHPNREHARKTQQPQTIQDFRKTRFNAQHPPTYKDARIFGPTTNLANFRTNLIRRRKQLARSLANPRIQKVTFHSFRHFYASMLFYKTKNILYIKQQLGHRCVENRMVYTELINFESDEWHVAHAKTLYEEDKLVQTRPFFHD